MKNEDKPAPADNTPKHDPSVPGIRQEDVAPLLQALDRWFDSQNIFIVDRIFLAASYAGALIGFNANHEIPDAAEEITKHTCETVKDTAMANIAKRRSEIEEAKQKKGR